MSLHPPLLSKNSSQDSCHVAIVASLYNASFVDSLVEEAQKEIASLAPKALVQLVRVPGSFEIPLAVKLIAEKQKPDAILALGVIIRGETAHADLIADAISQHLLKISLHYSVPVIHEVLLLNNETEAMARCLGEGFNRGAEAARTALAMIEVTCTI
jgi:6,7-dimethyl-8-ribityllumazine synthase